MDDSNAGSKVFVRSLFPIAQSTFPMLLYLVQVQ